MLSYFITYFLRFSRATAHFHRYNSRNTLITGESGILEGYSRDAGTTTSRRCLLHFKAITIIASATSFSRNIIPCTAAPTPNLTELTDEGRASFEWSAAWASFGGISGSRRWRPDEGFPTYTGSADCERRERATAGVDIFHLPLLYAPLMDKGRGTESELGRSAFPAACLPRCLPACLSGRGPAGVLSVTGPL